MLHEARGAGTRYVNLAPTPLSIDCRERQIPFKTHSWYERGKTSVPSITCGTADKTTYLRRKVDDMQDIDHGEMLAIAEALDAAIRLARSGEFKGAARIFSD